MILTAVEIGNSFPMVVHSKSSGCPFEILWLSIRNPVVVHSKSYGCPIEVHWLSNQNPMVIHSKSNGCSSEVRWLFTPYSLAFQIRQSNVLLEFLLMQSRPAFNANRSYLVLLYLVSGNMCSNERNNSSSY